MLPFPARAELLARPLEAERVTLRPPETADCDSIWDAIESSRSWLQPWLPWVPYQQEPASAARFIEASIADWDGGRAARFVIRERTPARVIGIVGLEGCVAMHRACELGYWLRSDAARRGFMTEAARCCVDFGFRRLGIHRLRVAAATDNHPSLRVIARLGFHFEGHARHAEWCAGRWLDHAVFSLLEHEWPPG